VVAAADTLAAAEAATVEVVVVTAAAEAVDSAVAMAATACLRSARASRHKNGVCETSSHHATAD
jgi:hypothetical protein